MTRIIAKCAGGLLAAALGCAGAFAEEHSAPAPVAVEAATAAQSGHDAAAMPEDLIDGSTAHVAAPAATRTPMPFDVIRTLQFLQDQIARGNGRAIHVQAMLLSRFGPAFVDADPSVWSDPRNRRAAVLFALSGGPPEVLRRLIAARVFDENTLPLAQAALSYVVNDLKGAERTLAGVDVMRLEPGLGAHFSLVLGQIKQSDRPVEALVDLDRARLLAPGGLVEEAALRLEVMVAQKLGNSAKADDLARQYLDRFAQSAYVGNYLARVAAVYAERPPAEADATFAKLTDTTQRLDAAKRRVLLLAVGRRALVAGNLELARLCGEETLRIDGIDGEDLQRGNLYAAAAGLAGADGSGAAGELRSIDRTRLHPADADILDAATSVLSGIEGPSAADATSASLAADAGSSPVLDRAQRLLDAVAGDLGEAK